MIQIKYYFLKDNKNRDYRIIQVGSHKEDNFKIIYKIINEKILKNQKLSLKQLVLFCSFGMIEKIRDKIDNQEIQRELIKQFFKNENNVYDFKNFRILVIEIMVDKFPKNIIEFSTG